MSRLGEYSWGPSKPWVYEEWFVPPPVVHRHPAIGHAEKYIEDRRLEEHPFFTMARQSRPALKLWVSQELVMTGPFSQIVLHAASLFTNVHVRAMVMEVARGEHGRLTGNIARAAHPWLLHRLRESIGIPAQEIFPLPETEEFLEGLRADATEPLRAMAAIGVGNERLIIPEYTAIKGCFAACWPDADYAPFLQANLTEDIGHSNLCYNVASILISQGADPNCYLAAARESVERRVSYFDKLCERCRSV